MTLSAYDLLRRRAAERIEDLNLDPAGDAEPVRRAVVQLVDEYQKLARGGAYRTLADPDELAERLVRSVVHFGPLTELLARADVEEIFIEGDRITFLEAGGRLQAFGEPTTEEENRQVVDRFLADTNRRLDSANPIEQGRILGGTARLTAVVPPVSDHLSATIRRYVVRAFDLPELVDRATLTAAAVGFLWTLARAGGTVLFSGPPGAGKTTLLSAWLRAVPPDRCVRVCEEVRELQVPLVHGSFYEATPPTLGGSRRYTLRDLVKVVLAQRPDLICVGEVRGAEAFELTRAVNAGCGFACTVHANSAADALTALTNAAIMAGENVPEPAVRRVFSAAIDVVAHLERDSGDTRSGLRRQVVQIDAVAPATSEGFTTEPIFERSALGAPLIWTGALPPDDLVCRLERALPTGVDLRRVLAGEWSPER